MDETTVVETVEPKFNFGDKLVLGALGLIAGVALDALLTKGYKAVRFRNQVDNQAAAQVEQ